MHFTSGRVVSVPPGSPIGVAVQLALGSWYFKDRACLMSGSPVGHHGHHSSQLNATMRSTNHRQVALHET